MTTTQFINRSLQYLFLLALIAIPSLQVWSWFIAPVPCPAHATLCMISSSLQLTPPSFSNFGGKILGWAINLIPTFIEVLTFYCLVQLLQLIEQRKFFTTVSLYYLRYIGITLILHEITKMIGAALMNFLMTFQDMVPKKFILMSGFSNHSFYVVVGGGIILLAAWVLNKTNKIEAERAYLI